MQSVSRAEKAQRQIPCLDSDQTFNIGELQLQVSVLVVDAGVLILLLIAQKAQC